MIATKYLEEVLVSYCKSIFCCLELVVVSLAMKINIGIVFDTL